MCDPLGRMERHFMEYHYCHEDFEQAKRAGLFSPKRTSEGCFSSAAAMWVQRQAVEMKHLWQQTATAQHLHSMTALFRDRMLALHKDFLQKPETTYPAVAAFLGVKYSYPGGTTFGHFNAVGGHRTDLCRNQSQLLRKKNTSKCLKVNERALQV